MKNMILFNPKQSIRSSLLFTIFGFLGMSLAFASHPTIIDWAAAADGRFSDGSNWVGGEPPTSANVARFATGTNPVYTVAFSDQAESHSVLVEDFAEVRWELAGNTYLLMQTDESVLTIGKDSTAILEVLGGMVQTRSPVFILGDGRDNSQGIMKLLGNDTMFEAEQGSEKPPIVGNVRAMEGLESQLLVSEGATMKLQRLNVGGPASGRGVVEIDGEGSLLETSHSVAIGRYGHGTLRVINGGRWQQTGAGTSISQATEHDGSGRLVLDGGYVSMRNLTVGQKGTLEFVLHSRGTESPIVLNSSQSNLSLESGPHGNATIEIRMAETFDARVGDEIFLIEHVSKPSLSFEIEGSLYYDGTVISNGDSITLEGYQFEVSIRSGAGGGISLKTTATP